MAPLPRSMSAPTMTSSRAVTVEIGQGRARPRRVVDEPREELRSVVPVDRNLLTPGRDREIRLPVAVDVSDRRCREDTARRREVEQGRGIAPEPIEAAANARHDDVEASVAIPIDQHGGTLDCAGADRDATEDRRTREAHDPDTTVHAGAHDLRRRRSDHVTHGRRRERHRRPDTGIEAAVGRGVPTYRDQRDGSARRTRPGDVTRDDRDEGERRYQEHGAQPKCATRHRILLIASGTDLLVSAATVDDLNPSRRGRRTPQEDEEDRSTGTGSSPGTATSVTASMVACCKRLS